MIQNLLFLVVVVMCLLGPADRRTLGGASAIAVAGGLAMSFGTEFRRQLMLAFLDPWAQAQTAGYQTLQAQVGFASGGLWGSGIGSAKAKYGYLPDAHTDFIFATSATRSPAFSTLAQEAPPRRRPTVTFTPLSFRFCACAWPCEP